MPAIAENEECEQREESEAADSCADADAGFGAGGEAYVGRGGLGGR